MVADFMSNPNLYFSKRVSQEKKQQEQFLRFVLLPETKLMLPLKQITSVLKISYGQIIPIPEMAPWVMGVYNWRGEIVWMIDLGHLVGLTSWDKQLVTSSNHKAIVIHPSNQRKMSQTSNDIVGLVISEIEDIESCNPSEFHSPPGLAVTNDLAPFLRGYYIKGDGDILIALDGDAILAAMPKM